LVKGEKDRRKGAGEGGRYQEKEIRRKKSVEKK